MAEGAGNAAFPTLVAFCVFRSSLSVMLRSFRVKHASQPSDVLADTQEKAIPPSLDGGNKIVGVTMLVSAAFSRIADLHGRAVFHD